MLKFALLLLFLQVSADSWENYIRKFLDNQIHQVETSETVWATGSLYYSSNEEMKFYILQMLDNERIKEILQSQSDFKGYLRKISTRLEDENLLLAYLLQEEDITLRREYYDAFINLGTDVQNTAIIQKAVKGESLEPDDIGSEIGFEHFLVAFHVSNNNITSPEFFQAIAETDSINPTEASTQSIQTGYELATLLKAYYETDQYSSIDQFYDQINSLNNLPYSRLKLNLLWGIDYALYSVDQIDKALHIQRSYTLPISDYLELESIKNSILASHGGYLYQIGKYQEAKKVFLSLEDKVNSLPTSSQASLYNNLSLIYYKTGESTDYVNAQLKALEIAQELENFDYQSRIFRNLFIYYAQNKNWVLANKYIDEAAQFANRQENIVELTSIYSVKATYAISELNDNATANSYIKKADSLLNESSPDRLKMRVLFDKASIQRKQFLYNESLSALNQILSIASGQSDTPRYLEALIRTAQVQIQLSNYSKARDLIKEVRAHDMSDLDFKVLILAQAVQADIEAYFGNNHDADQLFADAANLVFERSRNTSETESGYWTVEDEYLYLFEKYADFLLKNDRNNDALALFDRIKTINDASLTENPLIRSSELSEEQLTMIRNLTREMDSVRRQILTASDSERLSLQNRLERLSAERRSLSAGNGLNNYEKVANIQSVQRQLRPSETLLHITEVGQSLYYAVVQRNSISIKKLDLQDENLTLFEDALDSILIGRTDLQKFYQIGQILEIDEILEHSRSLIVMPDSYFHQLPFDILPIQAPASSFSYGSADYLIEHAEVRTLNSLQDLNTRNQSSDHSFGFSGFGVEDFKNESTSRSLVSLPKAPQEIISVKEQLNRLPNNQSFINASATAEQFQQNAGQSKILHMATHSEVSESDPLFSTLHFYSDGEEGEDQLLSGRLFAYELFDLNLQNDLIMLNSCESGGDRFLQGSGVMGISRALRYAGAKSLVLNAWSVNDHYAAEFAEVFYKHINNGESKSKALQLTKIHFIKNKNANPHYWGSYILNGDHRPLVTTHNWFAGSLLLAAIFLSGLVITGRKRQNTAA